MNLTVRELQILKLLATGRRNNVIAKELGLHMRSVEKYRESIRDKAGCESAFQLGAWAAKRGLI